MSLHASRHFFKSRRTSECAPLQVANPSVAVRALFIGTTDSATRRTSEIADAVKAVRVAASFLQLEAAEQACATHAHGLVDCTDDVTLGKKGHKVARARQSVSARAHFVSFFVAASRVARYE